MQTVSQADWNEQRISIFECSSLSSASLSITSFVLPQLQEHQLHIIPSHKYYVCQYDLYIRNTDSIWI